MPIVAVDCSYYFPSFFMKRVISFFATATIALSIVPTAGAMMMKGTGPKKPAVMQHMMGKMMKKNVVMSSKLVKARVSVRATREAKLKLDSMNWYHTRAMSPSAPSAQ